MTVSTSLRQPRITAALFALAAFSVFASPASAKTLVYCADGNPESFHPAASTLPASFDANHQIYDRLLKMEASGARGVPSLAEYWEVSPEGLTYTFHLRRGVKWQSVPGFSPSRDFNADDVIFTLERVWKADSPFYTAPGTEGGAFDGAEFLKHLKSLEKVDDNTLRMTLNFPYAPVLANLASDYLGIQSKEYADQLLKAGTPKKLDVQPVGTGPFVMAENRKDAAIHFVAFPLYWAGQGQLDDLVFAITPDASARWEKIKRGECHIMARPNPADLEAIRANNKVEVAESVGMNVQYVAFNAQKKPFDDVRVRKAITLAVDKKAIVKAVFGAVALPAVNPISPSLWSYNKGIMDAPYYPEPGKKLLGEAGYPEGFATEIWVASAKTPGDADAKRIAEMIQANLAQIGVKAEIKTLDADELRTRVQNGEHQMAVLTATSENGDPDSILGTLFACENGVPGPRNAARWCNAAYQELNGKAVVNYYYGERGSLYQQAQSLIKREAPWLPIAYMLRQDVVNKEVKGFRPSLLSAHDFTGVDLVPVK